MFLKSFIGLFAVAVIFVGLASAQSVQPVSGTVEMDKDGTRVPVEGAKVDLFREDVKGQGQTTKTGADGKFTFAGVQSGHTYLLSISAAGASPAYNTDVKAGMESILITLAAGDGRSVTEDELKEALTKLSADDKKAQAEYQQKVREHEEKKRKVEQSTKVIDASIKAGGEAFNKKDYTTAIAKYDEGIAADPDFEGSAPVLLNNKGAALQNRARGAVVDAQKGDAAAKAAAKEKAKADYDMAIASFERGLEILAKAPADSTAKTALPENRKNIYRNYLITLGQMYETSIAVPDNVDAAKVVEGYIQSSTDQKQRTADLLSFGDNAMRGGAIEASAMAYKKVLEATPKDLDALGGAAVALGALAFTTDPPNKQYMQEAAKYGKQYLDAAPKDHKSQAAVQDIMDNIKSP